MTEIRSGKSKWLRGTLAVALAVLLAVGVYLVWPSRGGQKVVAYFPTAVGLYPGDDVRIVGVPIGRIDSIQPRAQDVKINMTLDDGVRVPANAQAIIIAPNLVSARFIQLTPAYTEGDVLADGFFGRIAEHALGGGGPGGDVAVEVLADDRVFGRGDDRSETG